MKTQHTLADFDSAPAMVRALGAYLHGQDFPGLGIWPAALEPLALNDRPFPLAAGHFVDLDRLTIFADNLVPHVLRVDGVVSYAPDLLARIEREELIPAGSAEEVEIRACAVHAVELIRNQLHGVTSMQLDYLLWNRGQARAYKAQPRHRTRTVFY